MANETTSTTLATLLPLITSEALFQAQERSLLRGLVRNFSIPAGSGNSIKVPVYPTQAASALTEGTAMSNSEITTLGGTINVGEVGVMTTVTDIGRIGASSDVVSSLGKIFGEGIALKIDQDIAALFDGFSTVIGSGSGDALTAADVFQGIAALRANSVPQDGMAVVLHPQIAYDLKSSITSTFGAPASEVGNTAMRNSFVGTLGGVPVYESAAISIDASSGVSKGAIFHRDAIGLAMMQDIKIETQREIAERGDKLSAVAIYGVGELLDSYGVEMHFDSSIVNP